jgi:hypothetical protein
MALGGFQSKHNYLNKRYRNQHHNELHNSIID